MSTDQMHLYHATREAVRNHPDRLCLSVRQPWADLIVSGIKPVENRTWNTQHRGRIWIHASKTVDQDAFPWLQKNLPYVLIPREYRTGGIIGSAVIDDVLQPGTAGTTADRVAPWYAGDYGFLLFHGRRERFMPMRGRLGLFRVKL